MIKKLIKTLIPANTKAMIKSKSTKLKKIILAIVLTFALFILSVLLFVTISYINTPLDKMRLSSSNLGVEIYNNSHTSTPIYYSSDKKIISLDNLAPHTINAFIAIEDKRFYDHNGYDIKRIAKASLVNIKNRSKTEGASTITQQLVKNILLNSEKTYSRKFKEILLSIKTEKSFSKDEILNMYLNSIYFGSNAYGIENASNLYFDKSATDLTINESAILASIIKSPVYYSPINHPDRCFRRKNLVLQEMYKNGYITLEELEQNKLEGVTTCNKHNGYDNSYNQQAIIEACDLLNVSEKELLRKGLKIYTYMDDSIQQSVQNAVLNSSFANDKLSMVADNDGKVLAYFGNSYYDLSHMCRNPASTVKPLLIYLPAIANNFISPATPILDEKLDLEYSPKNAGDHYMGWISARDALTHSSNVCAVKILNEVGLNTVNDYGFKLNLFNTYQSNPSIALGDIGGGVTPISLIRAYSVLQSNGIDKGITFIDKIEDGNGNILYQNQGYNNKLFNEDDCMLVNNMLIDCAKSGTAKRLNDLPFEVASKTGTALNNGKNTDLWNIAYTTDHISLSWCGDATSKGLEESASSGFYPTLINKSILSSLYSSNKPNSFKLSSNIVKVALDCIDYENNHTLSLAPENTPERYIKYDWFKAENVPTNISTTYANPTLNLDAELSIKGTKFSLDTSPIFTYEVFAINGDQIRKIGEYSDDLYDDKVFGYNTISYYVEATNIYTKQIFTSHQVSLNPQSYLIEKLNNDYISQNRQTKKKWYV